MALKHSGISKINFEFITAVPAKESDYLFISNSQIPNAGKGLFTAIKIEPHEIVAIFTGKILKSDEVRSKITLHQDTYFMNMPDGNILDCKNSKCFAKYANDAEGFSKTKFKNNCLITVNEADEICSVAIKTIRTGEEIFCGYGKKYWANYKKQNLQSPKK